jgi:FixJ family two-component response regulator
VGKAVLCLDDDRDVREAFAGLLEALGYDCLPAASYDEMVALGERALTAEVAVLDLNLGANVPSGIAAYHWLADRHFPGTIAFLTGHARHHALVSQVARLGLAQVLEKPITLGELRALLGHGDGAR